MRMISNHGGFALVAAIVILLVFSVVAALMVSLVSNDSDISLYHKRASEATYIANGGMQYAMMDYYPLYPDFSIPPFSTRGVTPQVNLGAGGFTVDPTGVLSAALSAISTTIPAVCLDKGVSVGCNTLFPGSGRIVIEGELIDYTGVTAASFTGATRGTGATPASAHALDAALFHAASVTGDNLGIGNRVVAPDTTILVSSALGFMVPGTIKIDQEYLYCTGSTATSFTGCSRGAQGSQAQDHNIPGNLTGSQGSTAVQMTMTVSGKIATGISGNAQRVIKGEASVYLDGWVVGTTSGGITEPAVLRWNGINWDSVTPQLGASQPFNSVYAIDTANTGATADAWTVGNFQASAGQPCAVNTPNIFRFSNGAWSCTNTGLNNNDRVNLNSVFAISGSDVWTVGNFQNTAGQSCPPNTPSMYHWNGVSWSCMNTNNALDRMDLNWVHGTASTDVWAVGDWRRNGEVTCPVNSPAIFHWNGAVWACANGGLNTNDRFGLNSFYATSTTDVWSVGDILNRAGSTCSRNSPSIFHGTGNPIVWGCANTGLNSNDRVVLNSIFAISSTEVWTVGNFQNRIGQTCPANTAMIFHGTGSPITWACASAGAPPVNYTSIYMLDGGTGAAIDGWAVGANGTLIRWNPAAGTWSVYPSPTGNQLQDVFMIIPKNFMRIGDWQEAY